MHKWKLDTIDDLPLMPFGIIHIQGRKPYYDWSNSLDDIKVLMSEDFDGGISLLVSGDWVEHHAQKYMKMNYKEIFEHFLFGMYTDETMWPEKRTYKIFEQWFSWSYNSMVFDADR